MARHRAPQWPNFETLARDQGIDPFDALVDPTIEEDLDTYFRLVLANDDEEQLATLLRDPRVLLGLSDAGHTSSQLCDVSYSSYLLQHWVRETGTLTLEQAIWRLTGYPAGILSVRDRGVIAPGYAADLIAIDPATVAAQPIQLVWNLSAGADRLIADSTGIEAVWVNGTAIRKDGADLVDGRPGVVLRRW
jgi:N-acyl-D-amino-acid deacylase